MTWILIGIAAYLTYYTFLYARMSWRAGNKLAGVFIFLLAICFPPLAFWLNMHGITRH